MTGGEGPRTTGGEGSRLTGRRVRSAISLWRGSIRGTDILAAGVFAALALGLGAFVFARHQATARLEFSERAQHLHKAVAETLLLPQEDLTAISNFLQASEVVTRKQFRMLTNPMLIRHKLLVYAFEWLPLVRDPDRGVYEAEAREAGLTGYRFWDMGSDGKAREASRRESYLPIHFMEPPSALALGFDVAAEPGRWKNAEKALNTGEPTASEPFLLLEEASKPGAQPVVGLYAPVFREANPDSSAERRERILGFAMAVFRVSPIVDNAATAVEASDLGLILTDPEATQAPILAQRPRNATSLPRRAGFTLDLPINLADRRWSLTVFVAPGGFTDAWAPAIWTAAIGLFVVLVAFVALTSLRTITRLRRQVEKVGPYRLIARLGHGAMGVVWEARHALLRRPTAVKLMPPGIASERSLARFEREVQLTAGLNHPSTIAIFDYGRTAEGVFYYAMELIPGINLLQLIELDGPQPAGRVVALLRQACGALSEAHAAGLIHRDIKPANIMICVWGGIPDFVKVLDFGLVKDIGAAELPRVGDGPSPAGATDAALSQDGSLLGTPLYMAPEGMSNPATVDARADIFALGAVGYFLLAGKSPYPGRTAIEVFRAERQGPPPPLCKVAPHPVPESLEELLYQCLSYRRDDRPPTAMDLDARLEACAVPGWTARDAQAWWQDRGPAARELARAQREERTQLMVLASESGGGRRAG
ncbi:MAG TPA: CHASE domain-containing protein [Thermoanaerobaculia bacterium]|nr:CHASE domain-containing protein [Thermoanaerobaculia bacterium]